MHVCGSRLFSGKSSQPTSMSPMREKAILPIDQIFIFCDNPKGNGEMKRMLRTVKEAVTGGKDFHV